MSETVTHTDDYDDDPTLRYIGLDGQITDAGHDAGRHLDQLHPTIDWNTAAADLEVHIEVARRLHDAYLTRPRRDDEVLQHSLF